MVCNQTSFSQECGMADLTIEIMVLASVQGSEATGSMVEINGTMSCSGGTDVLGFGGDGSRPLVSYGLRVGIPWTNYGGHDWEVRSIVCLAQQRVDL